MTIPAQPPPPPCGPPPKARRGTAIWFAFAAVLVAAIVGGLLIWQPWKSATIASFNLDHGLRVEVAVPSGWKVIESTREGQQIVALAPNSETRSSLRDFEDAMAPAHLVVFAAVPDCLSEASTWDLLPHLDVRDGMAYATAGGMILVDSGVCLTASGIDSNPGSTVDDTRASDLMHQLVKEDSISATVNRGEAQ